MWVVLTTGEYDAWIKSLSVEEQAAIGQQVNYLRREGPRLERPHADTLNGSRHANMKELRVKAGKSVLRVAFAFDPKRTGILLAAGNKAVVASRRFYKTLIADADERYERHLKALRKGR